MAKKLGTPNYFDYYVGGKGSGVTPDLFSQYTGSKSINLSVKTEDEEEDEATKRLKKEIENLEKRAADAGVETKKDKRNALEKALNLGQDQGLIGDTFELMMRPINGIANAQNEAAKSVQPLKEKLERGEITEKQYYEEVNKMDKEGFKNLGKDFVDGLAGRKKVTSEDTLETVGMEEGWGRTLAGLGLDIVQDPLNVTGGAIGKAITGTAKLTGKGIDQAFKVAGKGDNAFTEGVANVADTFKQAFVQTAPNSVKNLKQSIEAQKNMLQEKSLGILNNLIKNPNTQAEGEAAARLMESTLKNNPEVKDFVQKIIDGGKDDTMRLRGTEKIGVVTKADGTKELSDINVLNDDIEKLVQDMNQQIHSSEHFLKTKAKYAKSQADHSAKIGTVATKYGNVANAETAFNKVHDDLQDFLKIEERKLIRAGYTAEEAAEQIAELGMNFNDDIAKANFKNLNAIMGKYDKNALAAIGLNKTQLREIAQDAFTLRNSMKMANKAKQKQIDMLNPVRINQLAGGEAGTGFQITKTSSVQVAKGLKDKESLIAKFGKDTVTIPRIQRELSKSPEAQQVATSLSNMQGEIVSWAGRMGLNIPEIEGYMRHAITEEYKTLNLKATSTGVGKQYGGNAKVINPRDMYGSAEDVNEMMGKQVFETNAYKAMVQAYTKVTNYVATESFVRQVIANPALATKVTKGTDVGKFLNPNTGKLKRGYTELKLSDFKFYKTLDEDARTILAASPGEKWIVDKGTANLMKNYDDLVANDNAINNLMKVTLDPATKLWKGITLMSLGYHTRNLIGNATNRHIAGMTADAQVKFDGKATQLLWQYQKKVIPLLAEGKPVTGKLANVQKAVEDFYKSGLRDSAKVRDEMGIFDKRMEKLEAKITGAGKKTSVPTKVWNAATAIPKGAMALNYKAANTADDVQRMGMYLWAKENKIADPVLKVKEAMFDYSDLTQTEKGLLKRVMPFYTFARKNLPFQIKNLVAQPHKYNNINKVVEASYSGAEMDEENIPEYLRKSMSLGTPFGENQVLKSYLPQADLKNFLDTPSNFLSQAASMTAPGIKLPFELTTNRDFFRDQEIRKFEGEKSESYGGVDPKFAYSLDQFGGKNIDRALQVLSGLGQQKEGNWATNNIPSLFATFDPKKVEDSKLYDRRKELQDLQKVYEQETGSTFRTISDIEKGKTSSGYFGF